MDLGLKMVKNASKMNYSGRKWLATGLETGETAKTGGKLRNARKTRKMGRKWPKTGEDCPMSEVRGRSAEKVNLRSFA